MQLELILGIIITLLCVNIILPLPSISERIHKTKLFLMQDQEAILVLSQNVFIATKFNYWKRKEY